MIWLWRPGRSGSRRKQQKTATDSPKNLLGEIFCGRSATISVEKWWLLPHWSVRSGDSVIPSGYVKIANWKDPPCYKWWIPLFLWPCLMGKSTISMAIFNSYFDITRGYCSDAGRNRSPVAARRTTWIRVAWLLQAGNSRTVPGRVVERFAGLEVCGKTVSWLKCWVYIYIYIHTHIYIYMYIYIYI